MLTLEQQRERDEGLKDLKITSWEKNVGYVFISYKSDNWKKVFEEKVIPLQRDYSLRVYSDKQFDDSNHTWLQNMDSNIKFASAVILFISKEYLQSYASFIELLTAINYQIAIIPVYLPDSKIFSSLTQDVAYRFLEGQKVTMNSDEKAKLLNLIPQVEEVQYYANDIKNGHFTTMKLVEASQKILRSGNYQDNLFSKPIDTLVNTIREVANEVVKIKGESYNVFEKGHDKEKLIPSEPEPAKQQPSPSETEPTNQQPTPSQTELPKQQPAPSETRSPEREPVSVENSSPKNFSVTGKITYSIYGKQYTDNQSNMMLNVFAKILKRHPEVVKDLPGKPGMGCVSHIDYTVPANRTQAIPSYFKICDFFEIGGGICVGTTCKLEEKLKKIALLIDICEEDRKIFQSDEVELPDPPASRYRTGGITYSIYGKQYTDNQSNMMLNVFAKILKRHPEVVKDLPEKTGMGCVSHTDYTMPANRTEAMPAYFKVCDYFEIAGGICVGAAMKLEDKLKKIALLIDICEEDREIFQSDEIELPDPPASKYHAADVTYSIYGKQYTDNQSNMMLNVFAKILRRHPEVVKDLPEKPGMNCVSHTDYTVSANRTQAMPSYFRICDYFEIGGGICVGTAYGIAEKLNKIARLIDICEEDREIFQSDNELIQLPAPKDRASRTYRDQKKQRRNFLED